MPVLPTLPPVVRHPWEATWWVDVLQKLGQEFPLPDAPEQDWKHFAVRSSAVPSGVLAVGFLLTLVVLCSSCCHRTQHRRRAPSCIPTFCLGVLSIVLVLCGAFIYWETSSKALDTAQQQIERASYDVTLASVQGSKMKALGMAMLENLEVIPSTCPAGTQSIVRHYVDQVEKEVRSFNSAITVFESRVDPLPEKVEGVKDKGSTIAKLAAAALLVPLALVLLSCTLVLLAVMTSCTGRCTGCCLRSLGPVLLAPTVLVVTVAASIQLEFGIVGSSFCADVDTNALTCIGKVAGIDSEEYKLSEYYIKGEGDNSLLLDLGNASQLLSTANQTISSHGKQVEALCSWRGLSELQNGANQANQSLEIGYELLSEQNVYRYYNEAIRQDICQTTMVGIGWLVVFQIVVGLLFLPMLVCVARCYLQARRGWYLDNEALLSQGVARGVRSQM
mmetsp:Transcript_55821/g.104728  ORF Transcript_55821/g.104728 Transcript_55821/m.104728 type:complete len:447 (+) Transcript_55821:51-1391(+)